MKLGLFKLEKKNMIKLKSFEDDVTFANYDIIIIFRIYWRFGAIGKSKPGCNSYSFINNGLLSSKS